MTLKQISQQFISKLIPQQEIAGLEVGEKQVRYLLFSRYDLSVIRAASVDIPLGTVVKGELKKPAQLVQGLNDLKKQLKSFDTKYVPLIVTLPSADFFLSVLELPDIATASYDEAVRLNITQLSPIPLQDAYAAWQNLGVNLKTLQREFLVGIAERSKINPFLKVLGDAGFEAIALESRSLSLLRLFSYFSDTVEKNQNILAIDIGQDCASFMVGRQGKLYFDFSLFWSEIAEVAKGTITREDLEVIMSREILRVLEFVNLHYGEGISHFLLFSPVLKSELTKFISERFQIKNIPILLPPIAGQAPDLWVGAIGAAIRGGLIPRENDDLVSVLPEGTRLRYERDRVASFVSMWSKIVSVTLLGLVVINAVVLGIAGRVRSREQENLMALNQHPDLSQILDLQKHAAAFNAQLDALAYIAGHQRSWSVPLGALSDAMRQAGIEAEHLSADGSIITLRGLAPNQRAALGLKDVLSQRTDLFSLVDLPLSSLTNTGSRVSFELRIELK